jgi:hypothetical protein
MVNISWVSWKNIYSTSPFSIHQLHKQFLHRRADSCATVTPVLHFHKARSRYKFIELAGMRARERKFDVGQLAFYY